MSQVYLGIDIGTQSVKTLFYDADKGRVVAITSYPLNMISRQDGAREQLAQWWIEALRNCLSQVSSDIRQCVAGISVSGQQHGFVALGTNGDVLAPVKLWCDTSTIAECEKITDNFGGPERCISEVGNPILTGYTAPKILWLKNNKPNAYQKLETILLPHDYINLYLTGERVMECGDASGTGLLDVRHRCWHTGMIMAVDQDRDLALCLPPLVDSNSAIGKLRAEVAAELGLPAGIRVASGGGDNMMAAIGTGSVCPGKVSVSLGTSGTIFGYSDKPIVDPHGDLAAFCSSTGGWLPLLCTMNCTVSTELTRGILGLNIQEMEQKIQASKPGANGVVTLPFYNGERTPNLPAAKASIFGLDTENYSAENLLRSAMESAVFGLRMGLDVLRRNGFKINSIRLTGGGSASKSWRQMTADIFNMPVSVQKVDEGAALGAALQAMWVDQKYKGSGLTIAELVNQHLEQDVASDCIPLAENVAEYRNYYQRYLTHLDVVTPVYS